ncbi:fasciclin-3 isoform X1 [Drosophila miranda]|uniref:fasciclin-3 isoform X1 n=1 Tax=Drosophila miranda TaxID=7229 RepID=UPI0007E898F9|nr:fasciclin-3 isoform X1 [Drosophila miranda]XP_017152959.1 fasciclin-3 isoform X1 [Drosophila miranda]
MSRIVFVLFAAILTDALTAGQVNVEPNTALLNEGDRTELLCRYGRTINYCRIEIPGEQKVLNLSPEWSKTPGFTYYGAGLQAGQCGVTIERVKASNNGQVKCSLGVEGEELSGTIDLVVALRPQQPIIELLSKPNREGYFAEGTQFSARCSVRDGRPPANISWYIDNMPANKRTSQLEIISTPTNDNVELSTSVQEIQWHLSPEDSNRKLVCRSHHQTDRETVPPQEAAYIINVRYAPVHQPEASVYGLYLDHTAIVNITIRASPLPRIEWTIEGLVVSQGRTEGRYSAYEPQYLGNDEYNVTLAIAGLTLEDTTKIYNLRATNDLGLTDYQVRISSSSKPPSNSLDVAAIVGIVVAVAVLVLVVLLLLFARATGRWCFGGKSIKTPTNETDGQNDKQLELGGGQNHGQNVALLETPNGITLLGASKLKEANGNGNGIPLERMSVERRQPNDEDDSFEYATDRESSVYNPTTRPLRSVLMSQAGGRNSRSSASSETEPLATENSDLLQKANQLGIPESRFARWLPKDKRELLEKQAMLLSGHGKAMNAATTATVTAPPATPPKPQKKVPATPTPTETATTTMATPKLPQETEI